MAQCKSAGKKEEIKQFKFAKNLQCQEMFDELLWRSARLRELYSRGKQRY